ncbi:MAG TPA: hypothetical protein VF713_01365 [Thermoanaerobaculia bacterium]
MDASRRCFVPMFVRPIVLILLTTVAALRLAALSGGYIPPKEVTMHAGETAVLAFVPHSDFTCGFPYHYEFASDTPSVATVRGFSAGHSLCDPDDVPDNGVVYVTAVAPGVARVFASGILYPLWSITVLPRVPPVGINAASTRVLLGQQVALTATIPGYDQVPMFFWYHGRIGDYSRPIRMSADPHLTFIGSDLGMSHIWVQAFEGSVTSSAEIGIEIIIPPRRPAVRH